MENSSKALIIAGAVLTSILLVATGVQVYNSTGKGSANKAKLASEKMWSKVDLSMGLPEGTLPAGWEITEKPAEWTSTKVIAIKEKATGKIVPLPDGFEISTDETEDSIEEGLVLKDGANEFVWIPVSEHATYTVEERIVLPSVTSSSKDPYRSLPQVDSSSRYAYDSQGNLDYYYGENYYNYAKDFNYEDDRKNIENSIRTYGGFYVGRYETTIDGNIIGVQRGKPILTSKTILKEGSFYNSYWKEYEEYWYRWWGLYKAQKDMYAGNEVVGSCMISSKQWDEIINYTNYRDVYRDVNTYTTQPDLSGSAYKGTTDKYDVSKNIYDLAGNVCENTISAYAGHRRVSRGGSYGFRPGYGSSSYASISGPLSYGNSAGSRVTLYIK